MIQIGQRPFTNLPVVLPKLCLLESRRVLDGEHEAAQQHLGIGRLDLNLNKDTELQHGIGTDHEMILKKSRLLKKTYEKQGISGIIGAQRADITCLCEYGQPK